MKALSAIVLGLGLLMLSGTPARAQFGEMGEAAKKGAGDAAKQEIMKGAGKAGLPTPGEAEATPAGEPGAAAAPEAEDAPGAMEAAPAEEQKVAPGTTDEPAGAPGADGTEQDDGDGD